jgi:hypothetical protein
MPREFDQSRAPGHLLRRAHQVSVEFYVAEVGEGGPTPPQFALLLMVERHPGASQAELVRLTGIAGWRCCRRAGARLSSPISGG